MNFLVFGEDWEKHPSTTQHLIKNLSPKDQVIWVNSIGMRPPQFTKYDCKRILSKLFILFLQFKRSNNHSQYSNNIKTKGQPIRIISPCVIPWHDNKIVRQLNNFLLHRQCKKALKGQNWEEYTLLTVNPLIFLYIQGFKHKILAYLRLDLYARLPGTDSQLINQIEPKIFTKADIIFYTAKYLQPKGTKNRNKSVYLPQGVDLDNFYRTTTIPSEQKILGFFGMVSEWVDFELIAEVANKAPDWTLEFIGPSIDLPKDIKLLKNIKWKGVVAYNELPIAISLWKCAWIPFLVNTLTLAVNPLKIREYLAAGLATHCTPLPEAQLVSQTKEVFISHNASEIVTWLQKSYQTDSQKKRQQRRQSVINSSWRKRALLMKDILKEQEKRIA